MFGVLRPSFSQLSAGERRRYASYYCNLCGALSIEYGLAARMLVVHDIATLAWLMAPQELPPSQIRTSNCIRGGTRRAAANGLSNFSRYLAAISAYTVGVKLRDDQEDQKAWSADLGIAIYRKAFTKAHRALTALNCDVGGFAEALQRQQIVEASGEVCLDVASGPSGSAYGAVAAEMARLGGTQLPEHDAREVGEAFGRAVYILDAVNDFNKDRGRSYNPLCLEAGIAAKHIPAVVKSKAVAYVQQCLTRASDVFRPLHNSFHPRCNAVVNRLLATAGCPPESVTLYGSCFIPCGDCTCVTDFDGPGLLVCCCLCLCCASLSN